MRSFLFSLGLGFTLLCTNAQEEQTNHVDLASDILDFLSRTELCLNSCRDAESTQAAIPRLKELKTELFNLRFQHAINQLDNPHKMTEVKHDIARVMTVLQELKKEEA